MKNRSEMIILVVSFDGYADIWPTFCSVFKNNWKDCPYPVKMVSNKMECEFFDTLRTGEETFWSERLLKALELVESKYVMILLEDYLLGTTVDTSEIEKIVKFVKEKQCNYFRLTNFPKSRFAKKNSLFYPLFADEEYAINLQAAIWNVEYLKSLLKKHPGNAWQFEVGLLEKSIKASHIPLKNSYTMIKDPLNILNGVLKGKWFPSTISFFKKQGIEINLGERGKLNVVQLIKYELIQFVKKNSSYKMRKKMKKIMKKLGMKFMSEY